MPLQALLRTHMCNAHQTLDGHAHRTHGFFLTLSPLDKVLAHVLSARWAQAIPLHLLTLNVLLLLTLAEQRYGRFQAGLVAFDLA